MDSYLLRGILIGLIFGVPVGAVGVMTVQRTWNLGLKAGLLTGLGSSIADCFYAMVGAFGLTLISDYLLKYQPIICIFGGGFLLIMGIRLLLKQTKSTLEDGKAVGRIKMFLSSFIIGITNPATILTFLFAFSYFGISGMTEMKEGTALVCGVFIGTYLWWGSVSLLTIAVKKKAVNYNFCYGNKVFGGILAAFGAMVLVRSF